MAEMKNRGSVEGAKDFTSDEAHVRTQARVSKLTESRLDPQPRDADDEKSSRESVLRNG